MSGIIWFAALTMYALGLVPAAVACSNIRAAIKAARGEYCHVWKDRDKRLCNYAHPPTCWRRDAGVDPKVALEGSAAALIWPLLLLPGVVLFVTRQSGLKTPLYSDADLARIERELGIGGDS